MQRARGTLLPMSSGRYLKSKKKQMGKYQIVQAKAVCDDGTLISVSHKEITDDLEAYRAELLQATKEEHPSVEHINFTYEYGGTGEH